MPAKYIIHKIGPVFGYEMIKERFGQEVADLVLSVTEKNKDLSWKERKEGALEEIKGFSKDSFKIESKN